MAQLAAQSAAANISARMRPPTSDDSSRLRSTVHVLAQCARDRTTAECVRCLLESTREVDWELDADHSDGGMAAAAVGFNCDLRFEVSTALLLPLKSESWQWR
ncbi:hypothetical protein ACQ4PT_038496 [Festuca glaucescens]